MSQLVHEVRQRRNPLNPLPFDRFFGSRDRVPAARIAERNNLDRKPSDRSVPPWQEYIHRPAGVNGQVKIHPHVLALKPAVHKIGEHRNEPGYSLLTTRQPAPGTLDNPFHQPRSPIRRLRNPANSHAFHWSATPLKTYRTKVIAAWRPLPAELATRSRYPDEQMALKPRSAHLWPGLRQRL